MKKSLFTSVSLVLLLGGSIALVAETGHAQSAAPATAAQSVSGTGTVKGVDATADNITLNHEPITALKWPAMTMDFKLADKALAAKVKTGDKVKFDLAPGEKGSYTIIAIEPIY